MDERARLEKIMEAENMNAKQFALEVRIQPGTISNIMSGRNKPSLDVMQRVLNRFRSINSDWLILGVGQMYRQNGEMPSGALFDIRPEMAITPLELPEMPETPAKSEKIESKNCAETKAREIDKIMIFYTDGTFEEKKWA